MHAIARISIPSVMTIRRHQPSRLEGFVDASFAFAVTLVIIAIGHVPESVPQMLQALHGAPTFAACFALLARIWKSHRDWSRYYDIEDAWTVFLSLSLVFLILIYVYPLRLLFSLMFAALSGGYLVEQTLPLGNVEELRDAYTVFSVGFVAIWAVLILLHRHALALRGAIGLRPAEVVATRFRIRLNLAFCAVSVASALLARTLPFESVPASAYLPGAIYLLMMPTAAWLRHGTRERLAALRDRPPE